ncbi:lytic transglycosylase domain-containing protein [Paracoccaceae bacterium]|nr:lytic transglycosylase domain-containing protein [Paracoccaceae bacterium]
MIILNRRICRHKIFSLFVFLSALIIFGGVHSQSMNTYKDGLKCEYLAKDAERRHGLPENVLLSISRVESGYQKVDGVRRAWPWTLNAGGDSAYFLTKEEALNSLKQRIKKGVTNIDIGCMQLNFRWHKKFFKNLSDMMNPEKNVDYGAKFLKKLHQRHGSWEKAVKYYHSSKSKFNVRYYKKVKAVWQKENAQSTLKSTLLASLSKKDDGIVQKILDQQEKPVPLIKISSMDKVLDNYSEKVGKEVFDKEKAIKVSASNFSNMVETTSEFDFTSFVKNVSRKNTALPKYIRDNWTIVLSIRNQLENNK